jgi:hypothetical protein
MKTVEEILRESGLTDEQIKALDAKAMTGLTQVLSTASQAQEAAELAKRAQSDQYDQSIAPALDAWANEKAQKDAEIAFYKAQLDGAKAGGFISTTPPGTPATPPVVGARGADGKFLSGANPVAGSPAFDSKKLVEEVANFNTFVADTQWKYRTLHGSEMPDSPTTIVREAAAQHMAPGAWAAKKYDFAGKEAKAKADAQKAHDDAIRKEAIDSNNREWAEKSGNNPMLRPGVTSQFATIEKAVKEGSRKDPLTMTREQRHQATRQVIGKEIADNAAQA